MTLTIKSIRKNIISRRRAKTKLPIVYNLEDLPSTKFVPTLIDFKIVKTVGQGSYGKVKLAISHLTGKKVAIKIVGRLNPYQYTENQPTSEYSSSLKLRTKEATSRSKSTSQSVSRSRQLETRILREVNLSKLLDHPNIVQLYDFRISKLNYYLIFEYVDGDILSNKIGKKGLDEVKASYYFYQIANAIAYCHHHSVVHRDIKIENVMITKDDKIQLIDFGLSNFYDLRNKLKTSCGTLPYTSPEILKGVNYIGPEVDVWSLGVVLFTMVTGKLPFGDPRYPPNYFKILHSQVNYPTDLSPTCRDLIRLCLDPNPRTRITSHMILNHPFLTKSYALRNSEKGKLIYPTLEPFHLPHLAMDDFIIQEMGRLLNLPKLTVIKNLKLEKELGWDCNDGKVMCRNCPNVALYTLIKNKLEGEFSEAYGTFGENSTSKWTLSQGSKDVYRQVISKKTKLRGNQRVRLYSIENKVNFNRINNIQIQLSELQQINPTDEPNRKEEKLKSKGFVELDLVDTNFSQNTASIGINEKKPSFFNKLNYRNLPTNKPIINNGSNDNSFNRYRKLSLRTSLQLKPLLKTNYDPLTLQLKLESCLSKLNLTFKKSNFNGECYYLCQYKPSLLFNFNLNFDFQEDVNSIEGQDTTNKEVLTVDETNNHLTCFFRLEICAPYKNLKFGSSWVLVHLIQGDLEKLKDVKKLLKRFLN